MPASILDNNMEARERYRKACRRALRSIHAAMFPPHQNRTDFSDPHIYETLPIRVSHLPIDPDGHIDFDERFFKSFDAKKFEEIYASRAGPNGEMLSWPDADDSNANSWGRMLEYALGQREPQDEGSINPTTLSMVEHTKWIKTGDFATGHDRCISNLGEYACEYRRGRQTGWSTHGIFAMSLKHKPKKQETYDDELPLLSCILSHNVPMDQGLTRSEIICVTHLMRRRMHYQAWNGHAYFPVLVCRNSSTHARIIQAHFDGSHLQMRMTDAVSLRGAQASSNLKLILRWLMADSLHNTQLKDEMPLQDDWKDASLTPHPPGIALGVYP